MEQREKSHCSSTEEYNLCRDDANNSGKLLNNWRIIVLFKSLDGASKT